VPAFAGTTVEGSPREPAAQTAPSPERPDDLPDQMVKALQWQWRSGVGEARLRLRPEHLGEITVTLRVERGAVLAVMRAESPLVQEWIQAHRHDLQAALAEQGLHLERLRLSADPDERRGSGQPRQQAPQDEPPRHRHREAGEPPAFDVRV
jgi:flagellar hook-length control protein FliK